VLGEDFRSIHGLSPKFCNMSQAPSPSQMKSISVLPISKAHVHTKLLPEPPHARRVVLPREVLWRADLGQARSPFEIICMLTYSSPPQFIYSQYSTAPRPHLSSCFRAELHTADHHPQASM